MLPLRESISPLRSLCIPNTYRTLFRCPIPIPTALLRNALGFLLFPPIASVASSPERISLLVYDDMAGAALRAGSLRSHPEHQKPG